MGLVADCRGRIRFGDAEIVGIGAYRIARLGLGYVPEDRRVFGDLSVEENLEVGRRPPVFAGIEPWTIDRAYALFPALKDLRRRIAGRLSGGEQQMLAVARTLMGNPRLILMDEPSEGLAPLVAEQMASAVVALKRAGLAILLSEQNLHFAGFVSDRAYVIEKGHIRAEGPMAEMAGDASVRSRYLAV
jgi:branched-chain amino acid transport system ATP-binding protein